MRHGAFGVPMAGTEAARDMNFRDPPGTSFAAVPTAAVAVARAGVEPGRVVVERCGGLLLNLFGHRDLRARDQRGQDDRVPVGHRPRRWMVIGVRGVVIVHGQLRTVGLGADAVSERSPACPSSAERK